MDVQVAGGKGLALGTPDLRAVGALAFGPDGILFVADNVSASIFAIAVEDAGDGDGPIEIDHLDTRLAALLGCARDDVVIRDLAVHPGSGAAYLSVMRGHGSGAVPLLVRAGQDGSLTEVPLTGVAFARTSIEDAPAEDDTRVVLRVAEGGELGAMNTPLDMVSYRRDGQEYLLVANSRHPLLKLACADIDGQVGLTDQSGVGVPRQPVPLEGVARMAVRGPDEVVMLQQDGDGSHLHSYAGDQL